MSQNQSLDTIMSTYLLHQSKSNQIVQNLIDTLVQQNQQLTATLSQANQELEKLKKSTAKK
jgi:hypothetical protein